MHRKKFFYSFVALATVFLEKAEGEAFDISHGEPFTRPINIYAGTYEDVKDAALIVITAGAAQKPGETRPDLVHKNISIFKSIIPEIVKQDFQGNLLIVANPVDSRSVHAFIVGEHGDSEIAVWSSANVSGIPLHDFCEMRGHFDHEGAMKRIADEVKNSAYEIIRRKGATYYGIAMSVKRICEAIIRDERSILPVSTLMNGEYGISDVVLSMPSIVGAEGFLTRVPISLSEDEIKALQSSAAALKEVLQNAF